MSALSRKKVSGKTALILTALTTILLIIINGNWLGNAKLAELGGGSGMLDLEYGYTVEKAYGMMEDYGTEGRQFYLWRILPLDTFVFGPVYLLCFLSLIRFFLQRRSAGKRLTRALCALPWLTLLFDYAENSSLFTMMYRFPRELTGLCAFSSCMTILKYVFTLSCVLVILALCGMNIVRRRKKRQGRF